MNNAKFYSHFKSQTMSAFYKSFIGVLLLLFRSFFRSAATFVLLLFVVACAKKDLDLPEVSSSTISGKLSGFSSSSSLSLSDSANISAQSSAQAAGVNLSQSLVSAMSCSSATASLYRLDSSGTRVEPALATCALGSDGSFSFNSKTAGVSFSSSTPSETLIVSVSGCTSGVYSRPITGAKDQHVTMGSTVLSYLLNTDNKSKVYSALKNSPANFNSLIATLDSATTLADAYSLLSSNSAITSRFTNLFGVAPTTLDQASPEVVSNTLPSTASELVSAHLAVSVSHFSSSYNVVYAWKLDGTVIGTQANWNWTPTANMQGAHTLSLTIGESDGSGNVDTTKPVKTLTQALTITNGVLPTAPSFSITTPSVVGTTPINTRTLTLTIDTGDSKANCASFSNLALTENDSVVPAVSAFTISCTQDGTQTLSYTLASSGDGLKTLRLWAIDASGTISSVASSTFAYLDTGSPTMTIATTPSVLSNNASQTFSFAATDNGGVIDHYECKMDGGSYAACSTPKSYSGLSEADHTFYVKAFDTAGNVSNVDSKTWHIDLTAPTLSVSGSPNAITNQLTATFSFSATDSGGGTVASLSCNLDSAGYTSCASPFINVLSAGAHTLLIKATDTAGNISAVQSFSWTIDTSLPTVTIASKPAGLTNSTSASFTFSGTDTGGGSIASYECNLDSAGFSACTSVKTYTGLAASAHTIAIRAIDAAGNIGSATSYNWTIDLTTPLASINSGPDSLTNSTSASFTFSANPPPSGSITGYECDIDSAGFASCSSPKSYSSLAQGSHTVQIRSIDNNGNRSSAVSQTWTVDTTAPTLTINSNPTSLNNSTSASFSFSATDSGGGSVASYSCKLDSASYASCSSPISYSSLAQGSHTFYVTATDSAGNTSSATTNTWTTDLTAPAITISANPTAVTNSSSANFTFSATDSGGGAVSSYQCSIDGAAYATCTSIKSYTGLTAGSHQFALLAIDTAGNTSSASTYSWTVDTTAPTISITSTPSSPTNATTASFSFSATDSGGGAVASYACKIDAGSYASCTSPTSYSSLAAGAHTFYITSTDTAGNTSSATSVSWTIDLTAPTVTITTPAASAVVLASNIASYAMSGACSENGQTVTIAGSVSTTATCASSAWSATVDLSAISDGTLSITAAQSDVAGNSATTASRSFVKDTTAPTISVTTPSAMQGNVSTGSVSWTLTETNVAASTNFTVEIFNGTSWSSVGTKAATAGVNTNQAYTLASFSVPNIDVTTAKIRVTLIDAAGNSATSQTNTFTLASTAPTIGTFQINSGAATTTSSYVATALSATSILLNINQFCLKTSSAVPSLADACWIALDLPQPNIAPSTSISFSSFNYLLSFTPGPYTVYAWVRDTVGNISSSSSAAITVQAPTPPVVSNILVANTSNPTDPVTTAEKTFDGTQSAYIKWKATASSAATITLSYQTNSGTTTIVSGLNNGSNSGCTVNDTTTADDLSTGCYVFSNAPSQYFSVTVKAIDSSAVSAQSSSYPLNASAVNFLAGKTDLGLGTSALNAILKVATWWTDMGTLVVATDGRIFFRDRSLGLLMVDPKDGILQRLIPVTGTASGDGGSVTNATLCAAQKIALDFQDRLLIFDCTKIRRINTAVNPMTIDTIIGGGATQADATSALSFQINTPGTADSASTGVPKTIPFFALPNGDIYFAAGAYTTSINGGYRIRKYKASDNKVYMITPSGTGHSEDAAADLAAKVEGNASAFGFFYNTTSSQITKVIMTFQQVYTGDAGGAYANLDPTTFVSTAPHPTKSNRSDFFVQGMDGKLYVHDGRSGLFRRFNESTGAFTTVVGGGSNTACPDGTLATACKINNGFSGFDAFVSATGQIYFVDYIGIVRTVLADGTVRRIMGQGKGDGDGGLATEARANAVNWVDQATDGTLFFSDSSENRIRKFTINSNVTAHAANANTSVGNFLLNPTTKELYSRSGNNAYKLPFASPVWASIGAISTTYNSEFHAANEMIGYDGTSTLLYNMYPAWDATLGYRNFKLASFNWSTPAISVLTGYTGSTSSFCASGTLAATCSVFMSGASRAQYDAIPATARWLMLVAGTNRVVALNKDGLNNSEYLLTLVTLPRTANSFLYRKVGATELVDYCAVDGKLYSYNLTTSTDTAYNWPITTLTCDGRTLNYNSSRDSLIFPARQNGLSTVIEYKFNP